MWWAENVCRHWSKHNNSNQPDCQTHNIEFCRGTDREGVSWTCCIQWEYNKCAKKRWYGVCAVCSHVFLHIHSHIYLPGKTPFYPQCSAGISVAHTHTHTNVQHPKYMDYYSNSVYKLHTQRTTRERKPVCIWLDHDGNYRFMCCNAIGKSVLLNLLIYLGAFGRWFANYVNQLILDTEKSITVSTSTTNLSVCVWVLLLLFSCSELLVTSFLFAGSLFSFSA